MTKTKGSGRRGFLLGLIGLVCAAALPGIARAEAMPVMADSILVIKSERTLYLIKDGKRIAKFMIGLGEDPVGPKRARGDGRTPEGIYFIDGRRDDSPYYRSLHLSYPNGEDRIMSSKEGSDPGGDIAIHGMPVDYGPYDPVGYMKDWTDGCVAVGNRAIVQIWTRVRDGTLVEIRP